MTTKQIIETITKELASYDERLLQEEIKWAFERKQAARKFRQSPEWQTMDLWKNTMSCHQCKVAQRVGSAS